MTPDVGGDLGRVPGGVGRLRVDDARERLSDAVEPLWSAIVTPSHGSRSRSTSTVASPAKRSQMGSSGSIDPKTSDRRGSNQRPRRSRTTSSAAAGPSADMKTRACTASAPCGGKPVIATMRAPRSQRAAPRSAASRDSPRSARSSRPARETAEAPGARAGRAVRRSPCRSCTGAARGRRLSLGQVQRARRTGSTTGGPHPPGSAPRRAPPPASARAPGPRRPGRSRPGSPDRRARPQRVARRPRPPGPG